MLIVATEVTQAANDKGRLLPRVRLFESDLTKRSLADELHSANGHPM